MAKSRQPNRATQLGVVSRLARLEALEDRRLLSLTPELVADLRVLPASSNPESFFQVGDAMYFTAATPEHGRELWISDGTAAGTRLVVDLAPGPASYFLSDFVEFHSKLYFVARHADGGSDLYSTDGTTDGTSKPLEGSSFHDIRKLAVAIDRLFFFHGGGAIAASDGSIEGTTSVSNELSDDASLYSLGNKLIAIDHNVYVSDGTPDGTFRFQGVRALSPMVVINGVGLFFREGASQQYELWKTDGTEAGTQLVKDIRPGPEGSISTTFPSIKELGGIAYFRANDGVHGAEEFRSDGTADGTLAMREIVDGFDASFFGPAGALGEILFFTRSEPEARGLYALRDGQLDRVAGFPLNAQVAFATLNGHFYFVVDAEVDGTFWSLWKSDGTLAGTVPVTTIPNLSSAYPVSVTVAGSRLWFAAEDATHGREIWTSDGTADGTQLLADISLGTVGADPRTLKSVGENLFFQFQGVQGHPTYDLWVLPGNEAPRQLTSELSAGILVTQMPLVEFEGDVVFGRSTSFFGSHGVWRSNGTPEGTIGIGLLTRAREPYMMTNVKGELFFATAGSEQPQLWKSDGTAAGTVVVRNLPGSGMSIDDFRYDRPVGAGGLLYFSNQSPAIELWRSDGTSEGTFSLGSLSGDRRPIRALGDTAFFFRSSSPPIPRLELWSTDGTSVGTHQIVLPSAIPTDFLGVAGDKLYFTAASDGAGIELWVTDGSEAGTHLVADIAQGSASSKFGSYTALGDQLVFAVDDGTHGMELWISDGTSEGTHMLDDAVPGVGGVDPKNLTSVSGAVFFTGNDGLHGRELWRLLPGKPAELVADIWPGELSAMEHVSIYRSAEIVEHQGDVYFTANDGVHGFELWKLDRPAGDTNFDGQINLEDLNNVRNHFGGTGLGDADGDDDVDLDDLNLVRNHFGSGQSAPSLSAPVSRPSTTTLPTKSEMRWERAIDVLFGLRFVEGESDGFASPRKPRSTPRRS